MCTLACTRKTGRKTASKMAEESKPSVDVKEFERVRDQVIKDETGADWKLAKSFEHTSVYRRTDNESIFKVSIPCCRFVNWSPFYLSIAL